MNRMKKFASIMLALVMAFALMAPAFAATTTYKITINNTNPGHTYEAYQIFTGDLKETTEGDVTTRVLSNIEWGSNIPESARQEILTHYDVTDVTALAEKWQDIVSKSEQATALAEYLESVISGTAAGTVTVDKNATDVKYEISGLAAGYYLIKDSDNSPETNKDTKTSFVLQVVADRDVTPKNTGVPTTDKTVKDVNDSTNETSQEHTADHDIGDVIEYQLKATLPATMEEGYTTYQLTFNDVMSNALDMVKYASTNKDDAQKVTTGDVADQIVVKLNGTEVTGGYNATYDESEHKLTVIFEDVMATPVSAKNSGVITIDYKAQLNESAKIGAEGNENTFTLVYPRNPNHEGDGEPDTGTTPPVIAVVFTFETVVNKTDGEKPLAGAAFELSKWIAGADDAENPEATGAWKVIKTFTAGTETSFSFSGLDDGLYKLHETVTPAGYNTIDDVYFKITATHTGDGKDKGTLDTLEVVQVKENGDAMGTSDTITLKFTTDKQAGSASTDVVNKSGATLPETGGIGTTIFYALGGVMAVGAVVLLVTKKRMNADK